MLRLTTNESGEDGPPSTGAAGEQSVGSSGSSLFPLAFAATEHT